MDKNTRVKRSYTLTNELDELLKKLAQKNGVSKTAIIEIAVREKADRQGVTLNSESNEGVAPV